MKKGKKAAIIIIAVIVAAAIVVGGLIIGGVIPVGNKRTASAKEIVVDKDTITACRYHPEPYKSSLKRLYGMTPEDVEKFYENNCEGWNSYSQTVSIKNNSDTTIVISNAYTSVNGTENIWICTLSTEANSANANYVTIAPGETGTFKFSVLAKGYNSPEEVKAALKKLKPSIVFAENKNAASQPFVKFDMLNAPKFAIDIKF